MSFPKDVKEQALVSSGRHCCLCHKFCGIKIELHHIALASEGGADTFDNCIPLCFDCHADMRSYDSKHPKGIKYTPNELKIRRENWYKKMAGTSVLNPSTQVIPADIITYRWISETLTWNKMKWLDKADLSGSLPRGCFDDFGIFLYGSDDPLKVFFDVDLENLRSVFVSRLNEMMEIINTNIFIVNGTDDVQRLAADWRYREEEAFQALMKSVHASADLVVQAYRDLVREAELRLRGSMVGE